VDALEFLGLQPTEDPARWRMTVVPAVMSGMGALFGGCGLAAATEAMERTTGRPTIWATAQYLSFARRDAVVDIDVVSMVTGHQISQARAVGRVGDDEIFTVNAALGRRDFDIEGQWAAMPDVAPPASCRPRQLLPRHHDTVLSRIDMRIAMGREMEELDGEAGIGRAAMWARFPDLDEIGTTALSVVGDLVPWGIGQALGHRAGGNSLDNTIRVAAPVPTEWILLDVRVHAVRGGFGHGLVHLWSEDGTLLGTASQSTIVRRWSTEAPK
jgi:acyl-CoA thioesterase-2